MIAFSKIDPEIRIYLHCNTENIDLFIQHFKGVYEDLIKAGIQVIFGQHGTHAIRIFNLISKNKQYSVVFSDRSEYLRAFKNPKQHKVKRKSPEYEGDIIFKDIQEFLNPNNVIRRKKKKKIKKKKENSNSREYCWSSFKKK